MKEVVALGQHPDAVAFLVVLVAYRAPLLVGPPPVVVPRQRDVLQRSAPDYGAAELKEEGVDVVEDCKDEDVKEPECHCFFEGLLGVGSGRGS